MLNKLTNVLKSVTRQFSPEIPDNVRWVKIQIHFVDIGDTIFGINFIMDLRDLENSPSEVVLLRGVDDAIDFYQYNVAGLRLLMRDLMRSRMTSDEVFHEYIAYILGSPEELIGKFNFRNIEDDYANVIVHLSLDEVRKNKASTKIIKQMLKHGIKKKRKSLRQSRKLNSTSMENVLSYSRGYSRGARPTKKRGKKKRGRKTRRRKTRRRKTRRRKTRTMR